MKLNENPIFLTQTRLVHRGGVLAAILIAALIGFSLLSGLIAYLAAPGDFTDFHSSSDAGQAFYAWTLVAEILVLVVGGFIRICRGLAEERKAGLWDSNRLTPLKPGQIIIGYWLGSPLRELYMGLALATIGLVMILLAHLPVLFWLQTQVLVFSTALFFGLLAVLVGLATQRPQNGIIFMMLLIFLQFFSFTMPKFILLNFLAPTYGIINLFQAPEPPPQYDTSYDWYGWPSLFGLSMPPIFLTLGLQLFIGIFLWRICLRRTAHPFQPLMLRREALILFGILLLTEHGLVWEIWRGAFPQMPNKNHLSFDQNYDQFILAMVYAISMVLAFLVISFAGLQPENIRLKSLRSGIKKSSAIFSSSTLPLALALTAVAAVVSLTQFIRSFTHSWDIYFIALGNLLTCFLFFSLLLEFCRLRFRRRSLGFAFLGIFIVGLLPLILGMIFGNSAIADFSLFAPGFAILNDPKNADPACLAGIIAGQFGIVILLFLSWRQQWKQLLAKT